MSESKSKQAQSYRLESESAWANAWKVAAVVGLVGLAGAAFGWVNDHQRFAFSYLFAYIAFLSIALGGVFFGLLQYLTSSGWSVTVRRTTEFLHWPVFIFVLLFVPIALNMEQLFPWTAHADHGVASAELEETADGAGHGGDHAAEAKKFPEVEGVNHEAEHALHARILAEKAPYLNKTFFFIRAALYFAAWVLISRKLFMNSVKQDESGDPALTVSSQRVAPVAMIFMALTSTFAAFDWMMSLEPSWISTIFGVNFFAQCIVAVFAVTVLMCLSLRANGHLKNAVNVEHFHDLGKLLFGFLVFWAYVNFSQYMLIWYASIPEETTYYHLRWSEGGAGWRAWSMALIFGHFIIPFFVMLSRNAKRALTPLGVAAAIVLFFHFIMVYWLIMPYYGKAAGSGLSPSLIDVACLMFVGGTYFALVFYRMTRDALVPLKDPRLGRALHFVNA